MYGVWRPLGCGDRLYVEAQRALPRQLVERLEELAGAMRDATRGHRVSFIDIGPYERRSDERGAVRAIQTGHRRRGHRPTHPDVMDGA